MAGGTSIPYGNVKNFFVLNAQLIPAAGATSISIAATNGASFTFSVPGLLPGDFIADVNKPTVTLNGNTAPASPFVGIGNSFVSAANTVNVTFTNTSTAAVTIPIETYLIGVARPDTVTGGFYS
jgi:hypothetical protein